MGKRKSNTNNKNITSNSSTRSCAQQTAATTAANATSTSPATTASTIASTTTTTTAKKAKLQQEQQQHLTPPLAPMEVFESKFLILDQLHTSTSPGTIISPSSFPSSTSQKQQFASTPTTTSKTPSGNKTAATAAAATTPPAAHNNNNNNPINNNYNNNNNDNSNNDNNNNNNIRANLIRRGLSQHYAAASAPDLTHFSNSSSQDSLMNLFDNTFLLTPIDPLNAAAVIARNPGSTLVSASARRSPEMASPSTSCDPNSQPPPPLPPASPSQQQQQQQQSRLLHHNDRFAYNSVTSVTPKASASSRSGGASSVSSAKEKNNLNNKNTNAAPTSSRSNRHNSSSPSPNSHDVLRRYGQNRHIEGYFVPLLALTAAEPSRRNDQDNHPEGTDAASSWSRLTRLFGGLVLISRVQWQNVLLWIASYQYIPLMAALCVTTANALLAVAATAILPVIEFVSDENFQNYENLLDQQPQRDQASGGEQEFPASIISSFFLSGVGLAYNSISSFDPASALASVASVATTAAAAAPSSSTSSSDIFDSSISSSPSSPSPSSSSSGNFPVHRHDTTSLGSVCACAALSFLVVLGTAVSGYKIASMVGDAFLDACRVVIDRRTHYTLPFYSLYCDICRIFNLGSRYIAVFVTFLIGVPVIVLWSVLGGRYGIDKRPAFVAAFFATIFEVSWIIFQTIRFVIGRKLSNTGITNNTNNNNPIATQPSSSSLSPPTATGKQNASDNISSCSSATSSSPATSFASILLKKKEKEKQQRKSLKFKDLASHQTSCVVDSKANDDDGDDNGDGNDGDDDDDEEDEEEDDFNPNFDSATANPTATQLANELGVWWARKIPKVRRRGFTILFVTAMLITLGSGLLNGLIALVEGFLYVSFVHLVAHIAARSTLFIRAVHVAIRTLFREAAAAIVALIIFPVLLTIAIANYFRFGFYLAFIQIPVLVLSLASIASHARDLRDLRVSNRTKQSKRRQSILSSISFVFWRVVLMNARKSYDYGAHWRVAQYIRVVMRMIIGIFTTAVVVIATWVALQSVQFRHEGYKSKMLQVRTLGENELEVFTDSFSLFLKPGERRRGGGGGKKQNKKNENSNEANSMRSSSSSSPSSSSSNTNHRKNELLYRGMCQRRWFSDEDDEFEENDEIYPGCNSNCNQEQEQRQQQKQKHDHEFVSSSSPLFMGDMAFFSMLAYVPNFKTSTVTNNNNNDNNYKNGINEKKNDKQAQRDESSFFQLFNFYRRNRIDGANWELMDQVRDVWEELRKIPSMRDDFGASIEKERREILRWSQLHLVESLRPPYFHFKRNRTKIIRSKNSSSSGSGDNCVDQQLQQQQQQQRQQRQQQDDEVLDVVGHDNLFVVRGTEMSFAADFWQNVIIFADVFLVEQLAHFVPGVGLLPLEFVRDLVSATNFIARTPDALFYHTHLHRYMRSTQLLNMWKNRNINRNNNNNNNEIHHDQRKVSQSTPAGGDSTSSSSSSSSSSSAASKNKVMVSSTYERDRHVVIGHSLGGVVASLSGPPLKIPAVAFSSPGTVYMSRKFGVSAEATEGYVTNMVVSNDLIPLIGTTNGEVHNINCEHDGSLICHSVQLSFWRILSRCGSMRKAFQGIDASYVLNRGRMVEVLLALNQWLEKMIGFKLSFEKWM